MAEKKAIVKTTKGRPYKIGDTGLSGGLVFYDWKVIEPHTQYCLEAAPRDYEFTSIWGPKDISVEGAGCGYTYEGKGMKLEAGEWNTNCIIDTLGKRDNAAQRCLDKGWFLPSLYELVAMYEELKEKRNCGDFDGIYWSSSEYPPVGRLLCRWTLNTEKRYGRFRFGKI